MDYTAPNDRYDSMKYNRCGKSGILLPALSLGLWKNFGSVDNFADAKKMLLRAFDLGITHFDLANNYGPEYGSAEETFGLVMDGDLAPYRDELLIATKAGYDMWPGPYGNWGSRKYLIASLDQSLVRMNLEYVDIFYHHRPDPETPFEETLGALESIVKSGKALYAGLSNHPVENIAVAREYFTRARVPFIIHQSKYSMFERTIEKGLLKECADNGVGMIAFSPLAQGLLSDKYLNGIPASSRAAHFKMALDLVTPENVSKVTRLNAIAKKRGESLTQMALQWILRDSRVCSAIIGASSVAQIEENVAALSFPSL
ncbi:MAG TPA: aldo/keto reductase, partial [Spirochaetota bacterium]